MNQRFNNKGLRNFKKPIRIYGKTKEKVNVPIKPCIRTQKQVYLIDEDILEHQKPEIKWEIFNPEK